MIDRIFDIHIKNLLKTLNEQNIKLVIDESARKYVTKVGFNAHYGARPILGIIRKEIRRPLSKLIISGDITPGDTVTMKYDEEKKEINWEIDSPDGDDETVMPQQEPAPASTTEENNAE
jgi:ATP-dependent Clp protease ATP-binding subunit ClpA